MLTASAASHWLAYNVPPTGLLASALMILDTSRSYFVKLYSTKHVVRCYVTILTPAEEGPNQVLGSGLKVNP